DAEGIEEAIDAVDGAQVNQAPEIKLSQEVVTPDNGDASSPPKGYMQMTPEARSGPEFGDVILLIAPNKEMLVPIFIGGTEALSIRLRLEKRRYSRPLTHDLLDDMVGKLGGKMIRAQVDALEENVYIGTVVLKRGEEIIKFDARPSDAIALAIGNKVPIFVSKKVLDQAGIKADQLDEKRAVKAPDPVAL
ncbi:MAG TPA: bifunctional nuclease family protein, partial [Polyangiaceae bacterium]|nr:bifunctional nuclease family protein [Polyangiaceae bacterium]